MKKIPLTQGTYALVDEEDYSRISMFCWCLNISRGKRYAMRTQTKPVRKHISMHRVVLNAQEGESVDHVNGDGLDNRKENLRRCTHAENCKNRKLNNNNTSGYKGVSYCPASKNWRAYIQVNGKQVSLGRHQTKEDASTVYLSASRTHFGSFTRKINSKK